MNAGELRNPIQIWKYLTTSDGQGGTTATYGKETDAWACVKPLSGSRGIDASQIMLEQSYELWMRYEDYPPLNKTNKILFENRTFTIHAFQIVREKRKWFKIYCQEDAGRDTIIFDENYQPITDEFGNFITNENA